MESPHASLRTLEVLSAAQKKTKLNGNLNISPVPMEGETAPKYEGTVTVGLQEATNKHYMTKASSFGLEVEHLRVDYFSYCCHQRTSDALVAPKEKQKEVFT